MRALLVLAAVTALVACARPTLVEGLDGRPIDPFAGPATVRAFVFLSIDCPISNRYAPELRRLQTRYGPRGVDLTLVYPDAATTAAAVREHLIAFGLSARALRDPRHVLAQRSEVTTTPEAAVFVRGALVYRGRIDDRFVSFGRMRPEPTRRDLADALDAALAGRAVADPRTEAIGCTITDAP